MNLRRLIFARGLRTALVRELRNNKLCLSIGRSSIDVRHLSLPRKLALLRSRENNKSKQRPMDDRQAQQIQSAVRAYRDNNRTFRATRPVDFPPLIASIQANLPLGDIAEDEVRCVTAMCILGPEGSIPPTDLRNRLLELHRTYAPDGVDRAMELAIAYGCGKWRERVRDAGTWDGIWEQASEAVMDVMYGAIQECNFKMSEVWEVPRFPGISWWKSQAGRRASSLIARSLSFYLIEEVQTLRIAPGERLWIRCTEHGGRLDADGHAYEDDLPPGAHTVITLASGDIRVEASPDLLNNPDDTVRFLFYQGEGPGRTPLYLLARDTELWISRKPGPKGRKTLQPFESAALVGPMDLEVSWCNCGTERCVERHRLSAWSPESGVSLWAFLKSAVKSPSKQLNAKNFPQGMYYGEICKHGIRES